MMTDANASAQARQFRRDVVKALQKTGIAVVQDKFSQAYLSQYGFTPATFIDVGVHRGTPALYNLFRDTNLVLIDPVPDVEIFCEPWLKGEGWNARFVNCALGRESGSTSITFSGPMTSLMQRRGHDHMATDRTIDVQIRRLDDVVEDLALDGPFGVKIDTEGFELEVLLGATKTLEKTQFVITEASTRQRFEGSYLFAELIATMDAAGFAMVDVLSMPTHARYFDCLFVRSDNPILLKHKLGS